MKPNFTLKNIKDFIKQEFGLTWYGEIYDESTPAFYRKASIDDFSQLNFCKLFVLNTDFVHEQDSASNMEIKIMISNNIFKVLDYKDLSKQWITFNENNKTFSESLTI